MDASSITLRKLLASAPARATVVDTSARDGLQAQEVCLSPAHRAQWIASLLEAGVPEVEAGSFVRPGRVPQMAGTAEVLARLGPAAAERLWVLAPNARGLDEALGAGARNVVLLVSATEEHSRANLGRPIEGVLRELGGLLGAARAGGVRARAAISMTWDPAEPAPAETRVLPLCRELASLGFEELTLCDTAGGASPRAVAGLLAAVTTLFPAGSLGLHLHDPFGFGTASALAGWAAGVARFDASIGGLGGCPFLPGAAGNLPTEPLVKLLHALGVATGIDEEKLAAARERCLGGLAHAGGCRPP